MAQIASHLVVNQPYAERLHNKSNNSYASSKNNQTSYIRNSDRMSSGNKASTTHFVDLNDSKHSFESVKISTA